MRIIMINGSPRKNGATATILKYISTQLEKQNVKTEIIHVADLDLKYCIGCCKCYETGKCIYTDDIENLSRKIKNADGIILSTPTYASNISGQLKTIIDRGHFVMEQLLYKKYAISVVTYENYGGRDVSKILNRLLLYSGASISSSLVIKNPYSDSLLENKKIKNYVLKKTEKFYRNFRKQKKLKYQSMKHFLIFQFGILPFVKKKGQKYKGVTNSWKKNGVNRRNIK